MRSPTPAAPSLLEQVRGLIERTYDHPSGLGPLAPFLVGDEGHRRLLAGRRIGHCAGEAGNGAELLVRHDADGTLRASLYLPDALIRHLEEHPPGHGLDAGNIDGFGVLVEEVDHLLLVAARARGGPALTLLELELHANVTKELVVRHFLARARRLRSLPREAIEWTRFHLFRKHRFKDPDLSVRRRYEDARRFALRYLERLDLLPKRHRLPELRRFSRMSQRQKLRHVGISG